MIKPYEVSRQKLIYVYGIPDSAHYGLLKIGETTFTGDLELDARRRIDAQTKAAGIPYKLFHTELALTDKGETFRDHDVHKVLLNSNFKKKSPNNTKAQEWFKVDLDTVKAAIRAVKQGNFTIRGKGQSKFFKAEFRDEQEAAIKQTVNYFKHGKEFLWNAKMRFGKTLCALEVVRRMKFAKTIIVTHRPDVKAGWSEDFKKIFGGSDDFEFGKRDDFYKLMKSGKNFVCFVSIQDLRGSEIVGGKFYKNDDLLNVDWNCVIVDEAHEGTQTALGDAVIKKLVKKNSKFLALSGTPFNIIDDYNDENTFTWDYIMEQKAKADWEKNFPDLSNPYADLPKMNIYTYNLGELIDNPAFIDAEDKSFSFNEFFKIDGEAFVHESDVKSFLDMLVHRDATNYPYAEENFRKMFRHTLWIIPGVKEGRALSRLLQNHRVFHNFKIVNVAGDGDSDDEPANALDKVRSAIDNYNFTITLSCGKLTTGVTVPEWSAVFMLRGGSSAMSYLQTIFRVQTPCRKYGLKENCYVFDFAPDRTLKFITEAVEVSARAGKTTDTHRKILDEFLKFCPVIAMHGSKMSNLNSQKLLRQLKRAYAVRAVHSGFEDNSIYNDNLYNLTDFNLNCLKKVKGIIGSSKSQAKMSDITVNAQGLTPKEIREYTKGQKRQLTPEEKEQLLRKRQRLEAISILRGISIRIPLLIYGADVPIDDDISIDNFTDLIDKESWKEFMPNGITQEIFNNLIEFYDREVFIEAGHIIRERAKAADRLAPIERVEEIANLFDTFKNPDKETVLTPWNVVKLHIDSAFDDDFFSQYKRILEINSKTGLYPLYVAEKIFKARLKSSGEKNFSIERQRFIWNTTIADNVFVICKTPMAKAITIRTLLGYRKGTVNAEYFADIIETLKHTPSTFIDRVTEKDFWHKGAGRMFFDAVVGNPPYQIAVEGTNKNYASPVYHLFMKASFKLADKVSLIHPARCLFNAGDVPKEFKQQLLDDKHFKIIRYEADSTKFFPTSDIKGGVAITLYDAKQNFDAIKIFTPFQELNSILRKVVCTENFQPFSKIVYTPIAYKLSKKFFKECTEFVCKLQKPDDSALRTNIFERLSELFFDDKPDDGHEYIQIHGLVNMRRVCKYFRRDWIDTPLVDYYKVIVPEANGSGALGEVVSTPLVGLPLVGCTQTFITVGAFDTLAEAQACLAYIKSKFCRVMLGILKVTQHNPPATWAKVPMQDFNPATSDIDWDAPITEIDSQLYHKYKLTDAEIKFIESHVRAMT